MKSLFAFVCLAAILSCNDGKNNPDQPGPEEAPAVKGKLYVESSIVGGLRVSWLWLGDDGTFVRNPKHGANPINYTLEKTDNAASAGHYTTNGNTISATYESGKTENWAKEYDGDRLNTIDGLFVGEADVMPEDYKISGRYAAGTFYSSVANISTFDFKTDGSFVLEGEGFVNTGEATGNAKTATGGTYTISGNTLRLRFNTGESSVAVIGIYKTGSSRFLVINSSLFSQAD